MEDKVFQKRVEDFVCQNCGHHNVGNGYTNHCQKCLYSKHVDINPGDRKSDCGGLMEPFDVFKKGPTFYLKHKCLKCGHEKNNKISGDDYFQSILNVSSKSN